MEAAADRADLGNEPAVTNFVLIGLGVLIAVLTVVACFGWLPPMRIVPDDTKFDFTRFRRISFPISALLSIAAIVLFFTHGLNFGIDFKGGTLLEVQSKSGAADIASMRAKLSGIGLGDVQLQQFGGPADVLIRVAEQPGGDAAQQEAVQKVRTALGDAVEYRRVEVVGPRVSGELLAYGMLGLMLAIFAILIYLWFRFEWQFALGAMIANVHDIVLTIGFMSISQVDFDLTSIAALLTILGYSLNDTVVIYDRIREMLRRYKKMPMPELAEQVDQLDAVALDHHPRHGDAVAARAAAVRRPCDPQLHRDDDVRRRAGRHLHLDLHRRADPDLSRRRHRTATRRKNRPGSQRNAGPPSDAPHLPDAAPIEAYGKGGFRLRRHVASRLAAVPAGCDLGWPVVRAADIDEAALEPVFAAADGIDTLIIGTGTECLAAASALREALRAGRWYVDPMQTGLRSAPTTS